MRVVCVLPLQQESGVVYGKLFVTVQVAPERRHRCVESAGPRSGKHLYAAPFRLDLVPLSGNLNSHGCGAE
jgi:hypothetical protein